ncbi:hypothetical protein [Bacillus thuringiensis]|uniref:hypothetical protein n=1 Tax=Bacillus thuringiensis TaxID=1428 RepID=UPI0011554F56|nr:hypothetical protein [Bacillus thuringiensis]
MIIALLSKRYSVGMDGESKGRKDQLHVYIKPRCVSVVAFVFLIEISIPVLLSKILIGKLLTTMTRGM